MKDTLIYSKFRLNFKGNLREFSQPLVMGILNVTPDSFYKSSRYNNKESLLDQAKKMINEGVDIIDIGGYSSRPGASFINEQEELQRVLPAVMAVHKEFPDITLSIDTFRAEVAKQAIEAGVSMINDISGGQQDKNIFSVAAEYSVPYILMHMRGTPENMLNDTQYDNLIIDLNKYFSERISLAQAKGLHDIIIDPGFGFSKTLEQNYSLLDEMEDLTLSEKPILVGLSRKSMIYKKLGIQPEESLTGTIALNSIAVMKGASILRVHDVAEAKQVINLLKT